MCLKTPQAGKPLSGLRGHFLDAGEELAGHSGVGKSNRSAPRPRFSFSVPAALHGELERQTSRTAPSMSSGLTSGPTLPNPRAYAGGAQIYVSIRSGRFVPRKDDLVPTGET